VVKKQNDNLEYARLSPFLFFELSLTVTLQMRTIRTLRAQLSTAQSSLDQLRSEQKSTKDSWTEHINDLKEKLAVLRKSKLKWDEEEKKLKAEVEDWKDRYEKKGKELEREGAAYVPSFSQSPFRGASSEDRLATNSFYDLKNQVSIDEPRLARIAEYELRIEALTRTLAIWCAFHFCSVSSLRH